MTRNRFTDIPDDGTLTSVIPDDVLGVACLFLNEASLNKLWASSWRIYSVVAGLPQGNLTLTGYIDCH